MIDSLDVYAIRGTESEWLGGAETLAHALDLVQKVGPGAYFVFSETTEWYDFCVVGPDGELALFEKQSDTVH
jgi:hypothetical protein